MRVLDLSGHYQRRVEIDTCPHCCLVWFDDTESVQLGGPGIAEFVREIHGAMQAGGGHEHAVSLTRVQTCPVCTASLKPAFNMTRFGRTSELRCPRGHGYYQTYILYLAEKGFVRPLAWSDIHSLQVAGKQLFCSGCGFPLPAHPVDECPACQSAVGVIDPARLAIAIDHDDAAHAGGATAVSQHKCHACGGAVDMTRDIYCPHCHAPVLRADTAGAAAAAALATGRRAREAALPHATVNFGDEGRSQWRQNLEFKMSVAILIAGLLVLILAWRGQSRERADRISLQAAPLLAYKERFATPFLPCSREAAQRQEVRVRQLVVTPGEPGPGPASATYAALRSAQVRALTARRAWNDPDAFDLLQAQYSNPYASARSMPAGLFRRGESLPTVERVAFCLPVGEISLPFLEEDGFHILQVLEAR